MLWLQQQHPEQAVSVPAGAEAVSSHAPGMTDAPRDAGPKQAAPARPDKAADFGYVGIDAILEQLRRKAMKQGFEFNIMVVGELSPLCQRGAVIVPQCLSPLGSALGTLPWQSHPAPEELAWHQQHLKLSM